MHSETFSGVFVPVMKGVAKDSESGFQAFKEAVKRRAESPLDRR
ncbi:hypothetical protein [Demequina muriae]|uniref:Uncharacterized protein n=1 Tax=Demequina muriae TaxID=3051664 RepID=A0ABT8GJM5_9MICO|nr:hypothetical protein [Demequina sp. EGI L300058]MDN4481637.1 hypothetical protein [Demequina sp. EGI L300058]